MAVIYLKNKRFAFHFSKNIDEKMVIVRGQNLTLLEGYFLYRLSVGHSIPLFFLCTCSYFCAEICTYARIMYCIFCPNSDVIHLIRIAVKCVQGYCHCGCQKVILRFSDPVLFIFVAKSRRWIRISSSQNQKLLVKRLEAQITVIRQPGIMDPGHIMGCEVRYQITRPLSG